MSAVAAERIDNNPGLWSLFVIGLLPALALCLFGPSTLYLANSEEFDTAYAALLPGLLGLGLVVAAVLAGTGRLLGPAWRSRYASVVFVLGLLLWAQGAFLMHSYGVLDGRGLHFDAVPLLATADLLLWIFGLAAAMVLARQVMRVAVVGSLAFVLVQSVTLAIAVLNDDALTAPRHVAGPPDGIFHYSHDGNIVHLVLDNFQTDVFVELVEEQRFKHAFDGFVLFEENTAVAPHTVLAVPAIFSGEVYDGSQSASSYYRQAMESGFHDTLFEHGYTVNLVPLQSMQQARFSHHYEVPAVYEGTARDRLLRDLVQLLDVSLFRHAPHRVRPAIYNNNNWRVRQLIRDPGGGRGFQHRKFFGDYIDSIEVTLDTPAYHFVHLWPPHPPFMTTAGGDFAGQVLPNTRENYLNETRPMVKLLVDFIDRLKALDVYDDALVIVQSDHGGGYEPEFMPRRMLGLMAVKPPGSRGPLQRSGAQTTVADVAATVMHHAGIENHRYRGHSVFEIEKTNRLRRFVFFTDGSLYAIDISGSAFDPSSYSGARLIEMVAGARDYSYGSEKHVGLIGDGGRYLFDGWTSPADRHVWSHGKVATLRLNVLPPEHDLLLSVDLIPHVHPEMLPEQRVEIHVNGRLAGMWVGRESRKQRMKVAVPRAWIDGPEVEITFILPDAASPVELGTGADLRDLGIALIGFSLKEEPAADRP